MVSSSILKKPIIPTSILSNTFLFTTFNKAHAENNAPLPFLFRKLTEENTGEKVSFFDRLSNVNETWKEIGDNILATINWFKDIPDHVYDFSVNLLTKIYELLATFILQTPLWIFNNDMIGNTTNVFSITSIAVVIILTMIEMIKKVIDKSHTEWTDILKRFPLAIIGTGIAPFVLNLSFTLLNKLSVAITKIGSHNITNNYTDANWWYPDEILDVLALLGFDIALIVLLFNIVLQVGRRWATLLCLTVLTPLSLTCWIFDDYRHFHTKWWKTMKSLGLIQIAYSLFLCIVGLIIFGTNANSTPEYFVKLLVIIGMMGIMSNPPNIITQHTDNGKNILQMYKDVKDTVTLQKFAPANFIRGKIADSNKQKQQAKATRIKTGKRYNP